MSKSYSRRELYALGEPLGTSATQNKIGGGRIYGGGGGGGFFDDVSHVLGTDGSGGGILGGIGDVVQVIGGALADVDKSVHDTIPGGWATIGAAALMAYGIYDPELLAAADEGTLTTTELSNAGYNAETVANGVSQAASDAGFSSTAEFNTALENGFTNATEYANATNAGFTNASEYANATLNGFTNAAEYNTATAAGFSDAGTFQAATDLGYSTAGEYSAGEAGGFANASEYNTATAAGFSDAGTYQTATNLGYSTASDYSAGEAGGFANAGQYTEATAHGFDTLSGYQEAAANAGFGDTSTFNTALNSGFTDASTYDTATNLGYKTASDYSAGELGGYANAQDWETASNLGYADNTQYQVGLKGGYANADEMMTAMTDSGFSDPETFGNAIDAGFGPSVGATAADYLTSLQSGLSDYGQYAAAVAAGLILPNLIHPMQPGTTGGGYAGESPWTWGSAPATKYPGVNPGLMEGQITPYYTDNTSPDQAQYYWGLHQPLTSPQNIGQQWNNIPNAPATPWGTATGAVGGTEHLDIPQFVQNTIQTPGYQAGFGHAPQPVTPTQAPAYIPPTPQEMTGEQVPITPIAPEYGGPQESPFQYIPAALQTTTGLAGGAPSGIPGQ